jgi:hypothetical protein
LETDKTVAVFGVRVLGIAPFRYGEVPIGMPLT